MNLIVNADDFGLSEKVNEGILKAHLNGIVTSTSIMANGRGFEHAIRLCAVHPSLDVGVHLTLVEERPLLSANEVASLVNGEEKFHRHSIQFIKRYLMGRIRFREVQRELEAQVIKVAESGIKISHLDSHQHIHMLPKILKIALDLGKKFNIPFMRFPRETNLLGMIWGRRQPIRVFEMLALNWFCTLGRQMNALRTNHFAGFIFSGKLNKHNLLKVLGKLPKTGTCELMCHPGFDDPENQYKHWGYNWSEEQRALTDPEVIEFVHNCGIRLVSYRQLKPPMMSARAGTNCGRL